MRRIVNLVQDAAQSIPGWGSLCPGQERTLAPFIRDKVVADLGCGNGSLSDKLDAMGAAKCLRIDKTQAPITRLFQEGPGDLVYDVAFVSWPSNNQSATALIPWLMRAEIVVYLGSNFDGTACGTREFFAYLQMRELLAYVPDRANSLIIVGKPLEISRPPTDEELAATSDTALSYKLDR